MGAHYADIVRVLRFWFEEAGPAKWFGGGPEFDALVRERLHALHLEAARGDHDAWAETPEGALALMILLDQAPRNMFRGTAGAFATDAKARELARAALDRGLDQGMAEDQRAFLYLPFELSEDIEDQRLAVRLFEERTQKPVYHDYARRHLAVIERFGRFPHRNGILGRPSTPEEEAFLKEPGSSF